MTRMLAGLLATTLLAAACSGESGKSSGSARATTTPSQPGVAATAGGGATSTARPPSIRPPANARQRPFTPQGLTLRLEETVTGLQKPVWLTHAGDGSGRMFVLEQEGRIRVVENGRLLPEPFLDIKERVGSRGSEQGLLGLAFHPRYSENGRFFVYYTANNSNNGDNTIAEFRVSGDRNRADAGSGAVLLAIPDFASNHNGGMLAFGPDGYLYAGTGDGGGAGDPQRNAENTTALLGKLLRLDVDNGTPYGIPAANPLAGQQGARPEIWAYGLRNPWRFSFDRYTGDLWIADVGQNAIEEINLQPAGSRGGENYGWSTLEGTRCFRPQSGCETNGRVPPVWEYNHDAGDCSVTGGFVYRGEREAALWGGYFLADYCSGRIWSLAQDSSGAWAGVELLRPDIRISSFGEDEAGELYVLGHGNGVVYRMAAGR